MKDNKSTSIQVFSFIFKNSIMNGHNIYLIYYNVIVKTLIIKYNLKI